MPEKKQTMSITLDVDFHEYEQLEVVSYISGLPPYTIRKLADRELIRRRFMEPQFRRFVYSVYDAISCAVDIKRDPRRFDQRKGNGGHNKKDPEEGGDDGVLG